MKLALYCVLILSAVGGIFYLGYKYGKNDERVVYQTKVIEAGERHANVEKEQERFVATRGQRLHIDELLNGNF